MISSKPIKGEQIEDYISPATQAALDTKADDVGVVHINGAETILGVKTFSDNTNADAFTFTATPISSIIERRLLWDDTLGTLKLGLKGGNVNLPIGETNIEIAINKQGSNLLASNYQVVYTFGGQGHKSTFKLAQANATATSVGIIGLVAENINNNQEGYIISRGIITNINTSGSLQGESWVDGDILYLSPTVAGGLTKTKPISPDRVVRVGIVTNAHNTQGSIMITLFQSLLVSDLNDVLITSIADEQFLSYDSGTGLWKNRYIQTADLPFVISGGTSSQFVKGDGSLDSTVYAVDSTVVHKTGNEFITGTKIFNNTNGTPAGITFINDSNSTPSVSGVINGDYPIIEITNYSNITSAIDITNASDGNGFKSTIAGTGINYNAQSTLSGTNYLANKTPSGSGFNYVGQNNGSDTFTVNKTGDIVANSATLSSGNLTLNSTLLKEDHLKLLSMGLSTGLYSWGAGGITITSGTTFDVAAASGFIINSLTPVTTPPIIVNYAGGTGLTTPYLLTHPATYILINSSGTLLLQNTDPTETERRDNIYLGVIGHPTGTLTGVGNKPDLVLNNLSQLRTFLDPIKFINDKIVCYANSTNLTLANTAGILYGMGLGFVANGNNAPSVLNVAAGTPTTFQYRTQTGVATGDLTSIVPGSYDVGGTVTAIPVSGTRFSNQRIYLLQNGVFRIQYGQTLYYTLTEAAANSGRENFNTFANNTNLGILIGVLSISKDCTDLSNIDQARFLQVNKFGEIVGVSAGQAGGYLLASMTSSANADQVLTTTASTIAFDIDDVVAYGGIARSGNTFVALSAGHYQFILQPQITQNSTTNVTTVWALKNGTAIPRSASKITSSGNGDSMVLPITISIDLVTNDVISFQAITTVVNGATLDFTAASSPAPAIPACIIDIKGWKK